MNDAGPAARRPPRPSAEALLRSGLGLAGAALLTAGAVAVFATDNEVGTAALLATGAALGVVGYAGERLTRFKAGSVELELARASALEEAATVAEASGDPELAQELRARAVASLREIGRSYDELRSTLPSGAERTRRMGDVLRQAREQARAQPPTPEEVRRLFAGDEGERIAALAAMYEHEGLRDVNLLLDAIPNSRSAFEQYHALDLVGGLVPTLDPQTGERLRAIVLSERRPGRIEPSTDRWPLTEWILRSLDDRP